MDEARWRQGIDVFVVALVVGMVALNAWFYRFPVGPGHLTEVVLVAGLAWLAYGMHRGFHVRFTVALLLLMALYGAYGIQALATHRPFYWTSRQLALPFYSSAAFLALNTTEALRQRAISHGLLFVAVGVALMATQEYDWGQPQFTGFLAALFGCAIVWTGSGPFWAKVAAPAVVAAEIVLAGGHFSFIVALAVSIVAAWALPRGRRAVLPLALVFLAALAALPFINQATDLNATWRYVYWQDVLHVSRERWFVYGQGVGTPFMDPHFPHYQRLVSQIGETPGSERTWSVPPHNSVMTLLLQVGLPGVVLFAWPIVRGGARDWGTPGPNVWPTWIAGALVVLMTNQFLETPYNAVLFWTGLGLWQAGQREKAQRDASQAAEGATA